MAITERELVSEVRIPSQKQLENLNSKLEALISKSRNWIENGALVTAYAHGNDRLFVEYDLAPPEGIASSIAVRAYAEESLPGGNLRVKEKLFTISQVRPGYEPSADVDTPIVWPWLSPDFERFETYEEIITVYAKDGSSLREAEDYRYATTTDHRNLQALIRGLNRRHALAKANHAAIPKDLRKETESSSHDLAPVELSQAQLAALDKKFRSLISESNAQKIDNKKITCYERGGNSIWIYEEAYTGEELLSAITVEISHDLPVIDPELKQDSGHLCRMTRIYSVSVRDDGDLQGDYEEFADFIDESGEPLPDHLLETPSSFFRPITTNDTFSLLFNELEDLIHETKAYKLDEYRRRQVIGYLGPLTRRNAKRPQAVDAG